MTVSRRRGNRATVDGDSAVDIVRGVDIQGEAVKSRSTVTCRRWRRQVKYHWHYTTPLVTKTVTSPHFEANTEHDGKDNHTWSCLVSSKTSHLTKLLTLKINRQFFNESQVSYNTTLLTLSRTCEQPITFHPLNFLRINSSNPHMMR
jgi:hypothetical protein